ncbi:hypothetical protein D1815_02535 [Aquimarina sp. AD1]|uniref:hypothetical protein n=1 Tax=Aquimarina sp. (strain AD1) TaxID=1714848 RepID=UPI000E554E48|nr:hypothetical protein [Aquimarina sp. AD1]AXT54684.1 hypothetical protein D1815_02535 [Aquimarina sp. AD1]RKN02861.1 hypothetical protein D7035_22760 [Aquimarina sp. AD1]
MKPSLELPKTLRAPEIDEVPMNSSVSERLKLRETAKIVEGFKILPKDNNPENKELAFNFYAEINIDNSKLWDLILELSNQMPDEISLIFNHSDCDPEYGKYSDKNQTLDFLSKYKTEIISDTFIDIGMIFHSDSELIEIFVPDSKYIKFWGVDQESFLKSMDKFDLKEIDGIEFVDEYPKVREPLRLFDKNTTDSNELIELFRTNFK